MRRSIVCLFAVLVVGFGCGSGGDTPAPSSDAGDTHAGDVLETPDGVSADEWRDVLGCYREKYCNLEIDPICDPSDSDWIDSPKRALDRCGYRYDGPKKQRCEQELSKCGHVPDEYKGDAG